ncbi:EF-P lysine aminoacylase GenX [Myxococcota bacterium]|nr:EF-P lysine aminoacylase GenX [Myxococcota bacterium]MBU1380180.1 EF-P lysine aminoacylase GenX [Myxococcota bacterium]MBU1497330.1 EF-P lysine aminoacylase GenX [Myxococcota bacterium]
MSGKVSVRIVNTDPLLVSDGKKVYHCRDFPKDVHIGNWVKCSLSNGECIFISGDTVSQTDFPGYEWTRLQFPDSRGRSRMDALRFRARVMNQTRKYFDSRGFMEVETPLSVLSPGVETHLCAIQVGADRFLSPSPEFQMKRLLAGGSGSIYQITKCFRDDETGRFHNPEFTMIEWYNVGADAPELMEDVEGLILHLKTNIDCPGELPLPPYKRISVAEAFKEYAGIDNYRDPPDVLLAKAGIQETTTNWEEAFFRVFVEKVEPGIYSSGPCFLTKWPKEFASLSRLSPEDPLTSERFEFFAGGLEIANGFHELTDYIAQKERSSGELEERKRDGKPLYPLDNRFLNSLAEAMPETAGIACGIDRLVMLLWGAESISQVLSFTADEL